MQTNDENQYCWKDSPYECKGCKFYREYLKGASFKPFGICLFPKYEISPVIIYECKKYNKTLIVGILREKLDTFVRMSKRIVEIDISIQSEKKILNKQILYMLTLPFDPIERAKQIEKIVMKEGKRKYYRFRFSRYYGGIVTADACGCCLLCAYCWNYFRNLHPEKCGKFYSAEEVVKKLRAIAEEKLCNKFRISGAEPILGKRSFEHLTKIIEKFKSSEFVLETNGLILGYYPELVEKLKKFKDFLFVRISVKGWDEKSFEKVTGAKGSYWIYPLKALKLLVDSGFNAWPAVMWEIFGSKGVAVLNQKFKSLKIKPEEIELEHLELYPFVKANLKKRGIKL